MGNHNTIPWYFDMNHQATACFIIGITYAIVKGFSERKNQPFQWGFFYFRFMTTTAACAVLLVAFLGTAGFLKGLAILLGIIEK
jgi:hypothetical protein